MNLLTKIIVAIILSVTVELIAAQEAQQKLATFLKTDANYKKAKTKIKHLLEKGAKLDVSIDNPLLIAIEADSPIMILALHKNGTHLKIPYNHQEMEAHRLADLLGKSEETKLLVHNLMLINIFKNKALSKTQENLYFETLKAINKVKEIGLP
ncbi:MAG: hypothetical protein AB7R69_02820 [Candidatus Babeliales bacterium]